MNEKEVMMESELRVIDDMTKLLSRHPEEHLRWNSTKQDLMEMIHILYESETVRDEYNVPVPFIKLVRRICVILGERIPRNPHAYISQNCHCQGIRKQKLLLGYDTTYITT